MDNNPLLRILHLSLIGTYASEFRALVEAQTLSWHPIYGSLVFSLLLGGSVDGELKRLYRNLGFLHVLVISGSQFTLLSRWLDYLLGKPFHALYAMTILSWRMMREIRLCLDGCLQLVLLLYLLASGATPPCQRAFLEGSTRIVSRWLHPPICSLSPFRVLSWQMLLFPDSWFTLSNILSWGAVVMLRVFRPEAGFVAQLKTSIGIQLLSLVCFGRLSLSSLCFDFVLAPVWELMLASALLTLAFPQLPLAEFILDLFVYAHARLQGLDHWQSVLFGSSSLGFVGGAEQVGRWLAALIFGCLARGLWLRKSRPAG